MKNLSIVWLVGALFLAAFVVRASAEDVGVESASHKEIEPLDIDFERLSSLRLHPDGCLLACDLEAEQIKVIGKDGMLKSSLEPGFGPEAIDVDESGVIYTGGGGSLAVLDIDGKVLYTAQTPQNAMTPLSEMRRAWNKPSRISGIAVMQGKDEDAVFVAFGSGWSLGSKSKLFRFDRKLKNPELIAEGLRGCCQRCDITAIGKTLYLAENSAHRVVAVDREGEVRGKWGERSRTDLAGFGSCCNPMNVCFDKEGMIYTAESGLGRVKRYTTDGRFLGLVGYVGVERFERAGHLAASCSNIAIDVTPDGRRVYVMDYKNNLIRVLERKD